MSGTHSSGAHRATDLSSDQIAAELDKARQLLTESVANLEDYVRPSQVASRGMQKVTDYFVDENGQIRPQRVAIAAAAFLGVIGLLSRDKD